MSPVHQNWHFRGVSCLCYMCPTVVAEPLVPSVWSSSMAFFACYEQSLVHVLVGQCGGHLVIELSDWAAPNCRVLFLRCPEKLLLVGGACSQTRCLPPAHCWGYSQTSVCGYLTLCPGQESLGSGASPCWDCLAHARLVAPL